MMTLHILGSNSSGNCYVLEAENEALILEAGISMASIKKALHFDLKKAVAALVSHQHSDHARHIPELVASGVRVLALDTVFQAKGIEGKPFTKAIQPNRGYKVGGFKIRTLTVKHDVPCLGFIIFHEEMGNLLFATDCITVRPTISGEINHIMIEANYADDILEGNIRLGRTPVSMRHRLLGSHMEINQTIEALRRQNLTYVEKIILIHLSDGNSDEQRFIREVMTQTGKPTYAAKAGMVINLAKDPF